MQADLTRFYQLSHLLLSQTCDCRQVASHAQKYLLRQTTVSKRKSRFCLLEQAASAQGLLSIGGVERCGAGPVVLPVFYGMQTYPVGQLSDRTGSLQGGSASSSDTSERGMLS